MSMYLRLSYFLPTIYLSTYAGCTEIQVDKGNLDGLV